MADLKISALTASTTPLAGTEVLPIVQSGATKQVSVANLTAGRALSATEITLSTGNLVIGTSGKGIDFSATPGTGTSELLADYEEGTWTPTQGTFTVWTTPVFTATYTKVGRLVTVFLRQTTGAIASGGAKKYIGGLPYTAAVFGSGYAVNGSEEAVSPISAPNANVYFTADTGAQTSLHFCITYQV